MNILFPIAGEGKRFQNQSHIPKPLIEINGKPMLWWAIKTLNLEGNYIFVILNYHDDSFNEKMSLILSEVKNAKIIKVDRPTKGSAFTCLLAEEYIDNDDSLLVTNCDQYLNWKSKEFLEFVSQEHLDACVSIYDHGDITVGEKSPYCFVDIDADGKITKFCEKLAISKHSMNGIHYWRKGKDFVAGCKKMIEDKVTVNGEFYFSSSFNYLIEDKKKILPFFMRRHEYISLGTPEDVQNNIQKIR